MAETRRQHPNWAIVEQMSPSAEQKLAIYARGRDVVVTAGAGTGKTRTLVARYLSLLAEGLPLRSVVAVTFTKKATREMRNRVRYEIRVFLEQPGMDADERRKWLQLYSQLDAARIDTIHGLCAEILRAHPAEAAIDPRFDVLDEGTAGALRRRVVDEAMAWAADDPQAVTLFALLGERDLRSTLDDLVRRRLDAQAAFEAMPENVSAHLQETLHQHQESLLNALTAGSDWEAVVTVLRENVADASDDRMEIQRQSALAAIDGARGSLVGRLASLSQLGTINLGGGRAASWPGDRDQLNDVKSALGRLRDLWRSQADVLTSGWTALDDALAEALPALRALFGVACGHYAALKRERYALDFDDLENDALLLLQDNEPVRARWQREVRAILVDEFQDTNRRQRDLVDLLNGSEGKLFIVGDAKQSIYRFRGADVTVFRAERERIRRSGGEVCSLAESYRAHRGLIDGLNDLLQPVLGQAADPARPWAEPFAPLEPHREDPAPGFSPPHVELHLTVGSKSGGALDRAAAAVAGLIVALVNGDTVPVATDDGPRQPGYGDFVILCRASTSFGAYEDALERAGIPFLTVAGRGFYGRPEIRDLLNALQALADPGDNLTLAGLLRSPALGLSDAALYHLCDGRDRTDAETSLWARLGEAGIDTGLSPDDGHRAARAVAIIAELHGHVGRITVADLLKAFLDATDYRAALMRAGQGRAARNVAKLLADAHASNFVSVGEFLEYVGELRDSGAREGEARATSEGTVQIMSIHAAKGLEFPVVVIGDIAYSSSHGKSVLTDPDLGVLLPLKDENDTRPSIYLLGKHRAQDQESAESDRLLYVAATRAQEKLILNGCVNLKRDGTLARLNGFLARIGGSEGLDVEGLPIEHDPEGSDKIHLHWQTGDTPVPCTIYEPNVKPPASRPHAPAERPGHPVTLPPPLLAPVAAGLHPVDPRTADQDRIPPQRVWQVVPHVKRPSAPRWVIGSLVHEALAAWRFPDDGFKRWCEARARAYGLTDTRQLADATNRTGGLLRRFQDDHLYRGMDTADRRLHEVPYSIRVNGRVESGIIDALYLRDGTWTIVEFKTDRVKDRADFERLLAEQDYRAQAARYAAAFERLLGERPRVVLCMLDYGGEVHLETEGEGA